MTGPPVRGSRGCSGELEGPGGGASVRRDHTTIEIDEGGRIFVDGLLVAEKAAGMVESRDELADQLRLHRVADVIRKHLGAIVAHASELEDDQQAESFGAGLADGLRGRSIQLSSSFDAPGLKTARNHDRPFRQGWDAGRSLVRLLEHLEDEDA